MIENKKILFGLLFAIITAAFLVRFIGIEQTPGGIYPDEAVNGMDAREANATGQYKLFYESNNGREGLFINLQAFSILLFGNTITALKLWSIIFGTFTVLGVFLLTRELLKSNRAGLIAAYLTAFSYWAINFSRIGISAIILPFILTFAFYYIFKGIRTKKYSDFIISGLIYGLGLYTYAIFGVSSLVFAVLFISFIITRKHFLEQYWKHILVFIIVIFVTIAPMLIEFFIKNDKTYALLGSEISIVNTATIQENPLPTFGSKFVFALAKYNLWGDQNWRHNYPPYPLLNPVTGVAFLGGLMFIFCKLLQLLWNRFKKGIKDERTNTYIFLIFWFFALLIPELVSNTVAPNALNSIGTLPVVMIIATIPLMWLLEKRNSFGKSFHFTIASFLIASLVFIGIFDTFKYHVFFASSSKQHEFFDANLTEEAHYIEKIPSDIEKIVIAGNTQRIPIKFLAARVPNVTYYYPEEIDKINPKKIDSVQIITNINNPEIFAKIQLKFPSLKLETIQNKFGNTFYIIKK